MSLKRLALCIASLLIVFVWAGTAQAGTKTYSLAGGGAELAIGLGLPLPIQTVMTSGGNPTATGMNFPPLLIPPAAGPVTIVGTTTNTIRQKLVIPTGALSRPAAQTTVGLFAQNPTLYGVATNINYVWPKSAVTLSTAKRLGSTNTTYTTPGVLGVQNRIYYSNAGHKFGGPAQFAINYAATGNPGLFSKSAVTIYAVAVQGPGNPPCTHSALVPPFPGPGSPYCVAAVANALPNPTAANGGPTSNFGATPGGTPSALISTPNFTTPKGKIVTNGPGPLPGLGIGVFGANPVGTINFFTFTPNGTRRGFTNMAASYGYPFTTGMLTISAPGAAGGAELFVISGSDMRTAMGAGSVQLVSGALAQRQKSGANANRGWLQLVLVHKSQTPAVPPVALGAGAGLILLAFGYAVRRRFSA